MSYELRALIGSKRVLDPVAAKIAGSSTVELAHGLFILPLKELSRAAAAAKAPLPKKFEPPPEIARLAMEASAVGPIAYLEADYYPGRDYQAAVSWEKGRIAVEPQCETAAWDPREMNLSDRPINTVLRALDVTAAGYNDEWDAVAMARHSRTEDW